MILGIRERLEVMKYNKILMEEALEVIIDYRGKTPKKSESGVQTLSAKSVKNNYIDYSKCYFISKEEYNKFMVRGLPQKGDILLTTEAPLGLVAKLDRDNVAIAQRLLTLRGKKGVLDNDYLLYYLQSPKGQYSLKARESGTTVTGIKQAEFRKIELYLPDYEIQLKIGRILNLLNDKIELNNKINKNLEQQAQAVFKSWFVDFEPFGGIMPSDWSIVPLSQIASFVNGYSYKSNELISSTTAMTTIKNFERKSGFKLDGFKEILPSGKIKTEQYVELFDVLVAHTDLTQNAEIIGNAELVLSFDDYDNVVFSMDLVKVQPKIEKISKFLIFAILKDRRFKEHCLGYTNGTTVLHLSKKALSEYKLILPKDLSILFPLDEIITIFYKQIASNVEENKKLKNLKDTLLPKLMSGEIDISEIDI